MSTSDGWEGEGGGQEEGPASGGGKRSRKRTKAGVYTSGEAQGPLGGRSGRGRARPGWPSLPPAAAETASRAIRRPPAPRLMPPRPATADVTLEDLSAHFHQPASKACQELGMGVSWPPPPPPPVPPCVHPLARILRRGLQRACLQRARQRGAALGGAGWPADRSAPGRSSAAARWRLLR